MLEVRMRRNILVNVNFALCNTMAVGVVLRLQALLVAGLLPSLLLFQSLDLASTTRPVPRGLPSDIWKNCGRKDPVVIEKVSIYPDPPKKGHVISLVADLRLEEVVSNGSVAVELKYGIVPLYNNTWALCDFAKHQHWHCPLQKGPLTVTYNTIVPHIWPSGHFTGSAVAVDQNSSELLCVEIDFQM